MRSVDLLLLVGCAAAAFWSLQSQGDVSFNAAFFHELDMSLFDNQFGPTVFDRLPDPLVTDLDGDGKNEIVIVTREPKLIVLDPENIAEGATGDETWERFSTKCASSLLTSVRVKYGRHPVGLAAGYLDEYVEDKPRKQWIVVVTQEWAVMLFDHTCQLEWEFNLQERFHEKYIPVEVTALVAHTPLRIGDRGMIIVGGRTHYVGSDSRRSVYDSDEYDGEELEDQLAELEEDENDSPDERSRKARLREEKLKQLDEESRLRDQAGHFSYYALDGRTGQLRWHHELSDFTKPLYSEEILFPQRNYKLEVKKEVQHMGEQDWRLYKDSMLDVLPHRWAGPEDSSIELAHFNKWRKREKRTESKKDKKDKTKKSLTVKSKHAKKRAQTREGQAEGRRGRSWTTDVLKTDRFFAQHRTHADDVTEPNVLVAHVTEGIEVLHLYTGRPLTKLALDDGVYGDMNGDHVPDHARVVIGDRTALTASARHGKDKFPGPCMGFLDTGVPFQEHIGNATLCQAAMFSLTMMGHREMDDEVWREIEQFAAVPPVLTHRHDAGSNMHVVRMDVVYLMNTGKVTALTSDGVRHWDLETPSSWRAESQRSMTDDGNMMYFTVVPSLTVLHPHPDTEEEYVLAAGDKYISLISTHGKLLAEANLPSMPISAKIVQGDINGDSWTDIIVMTKDGFYGFYLEPRVGITLFRIMTGAMVVLLLALFVFKQASDVNAGKGGRAARKVASD